jgi:hypothetical protein
MTDSIFKLPDFRMNCYKILPCCKKFAHDWTQCNFKHDKERAIRRDHRIYLYKPIMCHYIENKKKENPNVEPICPKGNNCEFAHNIFEVYMHPDKYRTEMCKYGVNCKRNEESVCFFAHNPGELRIVGYPGVRIPDIESPCSSSCMSDIIDTASLVSILADVSITHQFIPPTTESTCSSSYTLSSAYMGSLATDSISSQQIGLSYGHSTAGTMKSFISDDDEIIQKKSLQTGLSDVIQRLKIMMQDH